MALCFGTAGAINLSQLKKEDVCPIIFGPINFYTYDYADNKKETKYTLSKNQTDALNYKLIQFGFKENKTCKNILTLMGTADILSSIQTSPTGIQTTVSGRLTILDGNKINKIGNYTISNSYDGLIYVYTREPVALASEFFLLYDALLTRFITDWDEAHP